MAYLIDKNIAIYARDGADGVLGKLAEHDGAVLLSALTLAELQRGIYRDCAFTAIRHARSEVLLRAIPVLAAETYGWIIAQCGWARGRDYDRMIAAHAINSGSVLVTNNMADIRDIPGSLWRIGSLPDQQTPGARGCTRWPAKICLQLAPRNSSALALLSAPSRTCARLPAELFPSN